MGIGTYSRALEFVAKIGRRTTCNYCGADTMIVGHAGICSLCELPLAPGQGGARDAHAPQSISKITELAEANDYDGAASAYDALYKESKDPAYLYAEALLRIRQSNSQIAGIRYDRNGFMEENAGLRDNAAKFASAARGLLNDAISACSNYLNEERPPISALYLSFICHMKLSNLREASVLAERINGIDSYLGTYSRVMLEINLLEPGLALKDAELLLRPDSFSINALFYIAMALFDMKRYGDAGKVVGVLQPHLQSVQLSVLASEIEEAMKV